MSMRLFHFSEEPGITRFEPRKVTVPTPRAPGREWLDDPLVWAIDERHAPMYLFPRDCPRVLLWPLASSSAEDIRWLWGERTCRMVAHIEWGWLERLRRTRLYRYEMPCDAFERIGDAGMWVSEAPAMPLRIDVIDDLIEALRACDVELRIMERLAPLRALWSSSLHVSGVRLRNAKGWPGLAPGMT
jgi:hypothetical protein